MEGAAKGPQRVGKKAKVTENGMVLGVERHSGNTANGGKDLDCSPASGAKVLHVQASLPLQSSVPQPQSGGPQLHPPITGVVIPTHIRQTAPGPAELTLTRSSGAELSTPKESPLGDFDACSLARSPALKESQASFQP